ncbi:Protein MAIN-LIKE 1 [Glycine max]|nr:Protein MAIN-LIKE 1 [Glycine max]
MGEVTITLDDVAFLLHMPITGVFHSFETLYVDEAVLMLVELLEVGANEARAKTVQCHGAYVRLSWLRDIYRSKCDVAHWTVAAQAYLLHLLGCTLFANKSATRVHVVFLDAFRDLSQSGSYTCEATALVHMYDNLNDVSKSSGGLSSNSRKRLERLFNLRIVTEGTETYDVMQDCLRIARGVTVDHNLYVWSRQRRRMEDA